MTVHQPEDAAAAAEIVAWAAANRQGLEIVAGASKTALGRPVQTDHRLDLKHLSGIVDYEPSELVLTVRAATPMAQISAVLAAEHQMLAFEPPDWRALLGDGGTPTLGGTIACNLSGPRRVRAGAARDHFLGFAAINGRGEPWKAGGRVVKNVTGYDLSKLMAGAYGTLSVLTEITVKVLPVPEEACTILLSGLTDSAAIGVMAAALNTPWEVSGAAHLPAGAAARVGRGAAALTALRLEGPAPSIAYRADALERTIGYGARLETKESSRLWADIAAVEPLIPVSEAIVWQLCPTPSAAATLGDALRRSFASAALFYDWGGGLVWLSLKGDEAGPDGGAAAVRAAVAADGGHATLIRAPAGIRAETPVFQPIAGALARLSRQVKAGFDPCLILNPGRMRPNE